MSKFKFSVIIITRNRANYLDQTLRSLIEQDYSKKDYEIIVVDNNSTDTTTLIVRTIETIPSRQHSICF